MIAGRTGEDVAWCNFGLIGLLRLTVFGSIIKGFIASWSAPVHLQLPLLMIRLTHDRVHLSSRNMNVLVLRRTTPLILICAKILVASPNPSALLVLERVQDLGALREPQSDGYLRGARALKAPFSPKAWHLDTSALPMVGPTRYIAPA